jgi:hypothetical protein
MTRAAMAYESAATSRPTFVLIAAVPVIAACLPPVLWWDIQRPHDS